jgi:dipeptidyl aminopeptidase/acylaminoacyl peptidase
MMVARFVALAALAATGQPGSAKESAESSLDAFLRPATVESIRMSPDGKLLSIVSSDGNSGSISILDATTLKSVRGWRLADDNFAHSVEWVDAERIVFQVSFDFQDFDVGQASTDGLFLLDRTLDRPRKFKLGYDESFTVVPADVDAPPKVLIEGYEGSNAVAYELDVESGDREKLAKAPAHMGGSFVFDGRGVVRYFVGVNKKRERTVLRRDGEKWTTLHAGHVEEGGRVPVGIAGIDGTAFFVNQTPEGTNGIERFDPKDASFQWLSKNPTYDAEGLVFSPHDASLVAVTYQSQRPTFHFPDPKHPDAEVYRLLLKSFSGNVVNFMDMSRDRRWILLRTYNDRDPGTIYLFDRENTHARALLRVREWIDPERMVEQRPIRLKARDGLEIDAYLWMPRDSDGVRVPLVVRPHGGPHGVRDAWRFDSEAQMLASRGYAVLAVNFRGSGGYGPEFRKRGYRQWGGAMIDDITDATRWVVAEGLVDPERICAYGVSYGAFAAMMSAAREPDLYRCVAGLSGLYHLPTMQASDGRRSTWMKNYFADVYPETEEERERQSPSSQADSIRAAVLLAHGHQDDTTPLQQYHRMTRALERAGNPAEVTIFRSKEGHGFAKREHRQDFYEQLLRFFDKHIGARSAGARKD